MPKDILLTLCYTILGICLCIAAGALLCMLLRLVEDTFNIIIFPSTAVNRMSRSEEDKFIEMYNSDAIKKTFTNKRIYKKLTSSLNYQMRKYDENKCKDVKYHV